MKKYCKVIRLLLISLVLAAVFTGCGNEDTENKESEAEKPAVNYEEIIYEDALMEVEKQDSEGFPVVATELLKTVPDEGFTRVYIDVWLSTYSFDGVKFMEETASHIPYRYDIDEDGVIVKKWMPKDGDLYKDSILEMTDDDYVIAGKMIERANNRIDEQVIVDKLKESAMEAGKAEDEISFDLEHIPGLEQNALHLTEDIPKGFVCVINEKEYEDLQKERELLGTDDEVYGTYVYRECLLWNEKTGLCTDYLLDYGE